jgi:glycosyltransferase involved in cell wall biosynthesis
LESLDTREMKTELGNGDTVRRSGVGPSLAKHHVLLLPSFYSDPDKPLVGSFFREQAEALAKGGLKVGVAYVEPRSLRVLSMRTLAENRWQITDVFEAGIPTLRLRGWNPYLQSIPGGLAWSLITRLLVGRYIRLHGRPDLIHAHNAHWAGYAARQISRRTSIPYVITEHDSGLLSRKVTYPRAGFACTAYRNASEVLVVGGALGHVVDGIHDGRRSRILENCVNTEFFSPPATPRSKENFTYLAVAHLSPRKGFDVLIRAFANVLRESPGACLRIGGEGPIKADLIALSKALGVDRRVQFLGELSRNEVSLEMRAANAFVLSSLHETFGVVIIEAMASGLPVVATRCGGPDDIITAGTGVLVEPGDVDGLAEGLLQMQSEPRFIPDAIREYAEARYGQRVFAERLENIYNEIIVRHRGNGEMIYG